MEIPQSTWLYRTAVLLFTVASLTIFLIQWGLFDPKPVGQERWHIELPPQTLPARSRQLTWLDYPLPLDHYSVQLTAVHQSGELDTGYGLLLGNNSRYLAIEVSPPGYITVFSNQYSVISGQSPISNLGSLSPPSAVGRQPSAVILPWQTWPHIRPDINEIWVNVENGRFTVRINREWLWEGEIEQLEGNVGWIGESFGETAVVSIQLTVNSEQ